MSDEPLSRGPSRDTLKGLGGMMRGYMAQRSQGHFNAAAVKGKPSTTMADHVCRVCGSCWGKAPAESPIIVNETCELCKIRIDDGEVAIVSGNRFIWVKSEHLKKSNPAGFVDVTSDVMDKIGLKFLKDNADKTDDPSRSS